MPPSANLTSSANTTYSPVNPPRPTDHSLTDVFQNPYLLAVFRVCLVLGILHLIHWIYQGCSTFRAHGRTNQGRSDTPLNNLSLEMELLGSEGSPFDLGINLEAGGNPAAGAAPILTPGPSTDSNSPTRPMRTTTV